MQVPKHYFYIAILRLIDFFPSNFFVCSNSLLPFPIAQKLLRSKISVAKISFPCCLSVAYDVILGLFTKSHWTCCKTTRSRNCWVHFARHFWRHFCKCWIQCDQCNQSSIINQSINLQLITFHNDFHPI